MTPGLRAGVHCVAATPFLPDESLDERSVATLLDYLSAAGCQGALLLGVLGEADRLSDGERDRVIRTALDHAGDRLQISVAVTHNATTVATQRAREAERAGAAAVMLAPPPASTADERLRAHFQRVASDLQIPVIIQDHPSSSGVKLSTAFIVSLLEQLPPGSAVKLEDPPTPEKIRRLRALQPGAPIFGGLGGVTLYHELVAGAAGTMTGFAAVEYLVGIVAAFQAGDRDLAYQRYAAALPLMVFEAQPGIGLALRKEILRRRGVLAHAVLRQPAPTPDASSLATLDEVLARLPARLTEGAPA